MRRGGCEYLGVYVKCMTFIEARDIDHMTQKIKGLSLIRDMSLIEVVCYTLVRYIYTIRCKTFQNAGH